MGSFYFSVEGHQFLLPLDGRVIDVGFYASIIVSAEAPDDAVVELKREIDSRMLSAGIFGSKGRVLRSFVCFSPARVSVGGIVNGGGGLTLYRAGLVERLFLIPKILYLSILRNKKVIFY